MLKYEKLLLQKRLISCFNTKDRIKFEHQHDITYQVECSAENCFDDYIGESTKFTIERLKDHGERDTKPHVLKHSSGEEHVEITQEDFKIVGSYFKNSKLKSNQTNSLLIKQERFSLNVQDQSAELKLLN